MLRVLPQHKNDPKPWPRCIVLWPRMANCWLSDAVTRPKPPELDHGNSSLETMTCQTLEAWKWAMEKWVESDFGVLLWMKNLFHMAILLEYMLLGGEQKPWRKVVGHTCETIGSNLGNLRRNTRRRRVKPMWKKGTAERHLPKIKPAQKKLLFKEWVKDFSWFPTTPPPPKKKVQFYPSRRFPNTSNTEARAPPECRQDVWDRCSSQAKAKTARTIP